MSPTKKRKSKAIASKDWIGATIGGRIIGIAAPTFRNCAPLLGIRIKKIPGRTGALYNLADTQRAAARLEAGADQSQNRTARSDAP